MIEPPHKVVTAVVKDANGVRASFTVGVQTFSVGPFIDQDDKEADSSSEFVRQMLDKAFAKIQRDAIEWTNEQWRRRAFGDKSTSQYSKRIIRCLKRCSSIG